MNRSVQHPFSKPQDKMRKLSNNFLDVLKDGILADMKTDHNSWGRSVFLRSIPCEILRDGQRGNQK